VNVLHTSPSPQAPKQVLAMLPTFQIRSRRGKFGGNASGRLPALSPKFRALAPLLETVEGWRALEALGHRVFDQWLARPPDGRQRAILLDLRGHLGWICGTIRDEQTRACLVTHTLPFPTLRDRRGASPTPLFEDMGEGPPLGGLSKGPTSILFLLHQKCV
jgi:hypothetical protein